MNKILLIFSFTLLISVFAPTSYAACSDYNYCGSCVAAAGCSWGGPSNDIKCRDSGLNVLSCPDPSYAIWWSLSGQCGVASANYCKNNTSVPPACSSFNGNCSSCLQQSSCAYDGFNCVSVNPLVGNVCPAGKTEWYWSSCTVSEQCSTATGGGTGGAGGCTPESNTTFCSRLGKNCGSVTGTNNCGTTQTVNCGTCTAPQTCGGGGSANVCGNPNGTPGKMRKIETCRTDGSGFDTIFRCDSACLTPNNTCVGANLRCAIFNTTNPAPPGCTLQSQLTCANGQTCYSCVNPGTPGTAGAPGSSNAGNNNPSSNFSSPAWIQTNDGDVHSNTKIDVP